MRSMSLRIQCVFFAACYPFALKLSALRTQSATCQLRSVLAHTSFVPQAANDMKKAIAFLAICAALQGVAQAQNADFLRDLKAKDSTRRAAIAAYLEAHPKVKARYTDKRGRRLYIHHIAENGKPVYYITRRQ